MSIRPAKVHAQPSTDASNRSGSGIKTKKSQRPSRDDRMLWGAGILLRKIYVEATGAQENAPKTITIQNYESLASYSWKDTEHPTIYVPGAPPKFTPPLLPIQLQRDNLTHSKIRSPAAAVDPLFEALLSRHPDFDMSPIQVVSDRNSLRNLLSFASKGPGKWRIDVDMIDNTMFINQWEEFRLSMINGYQDSGFGHAFEGCVTTREPGMDAIHHERIIRYELGGLGCLVRFEADAYLGTDGNESGEGDGHERLASLSLSPASPKPSIPVLKPPYKLVHVVSGGHDVDPDQIAEIKSCSRSKFDISKALPQLWFSQTKYLCVGYHKDGLVTQEPEMRDVTEELRKWDAA